MRWAALLLCCGVLVGCGADPGVSPSTSSGSGGAGGSGGGSGGGGQGGGAGGPLAGGDCDPMVPTQCGMPFPSNVWLVDDPGTPSGKRVSFGPTTLPEVLGKGGKHLDPKMVNDLDGFSAAQAPMTHLPGATVTGLPTQDDIGASLGKNSPTILLEAETGAPVPHFAELDMLSDKDTDRAFMLRPVVRLKDATRYIVAIRHVVDGNGKELAPNDIFKALRDGSEHADSTVAARRDLYGDILGKLDKAGYDTGDLQIAWDFTTASRDNNTRWLVHMRDDALATVGAEGPEYTVTGVEEDPNPYLKRKIHGMMKVPLYLDKPEAGGKLVLGADGMPEQNGTAEFEFLVLVPNSCADGSQCGLLQNGHGLLGHLTEGDDGYLARIADEGKLVAFSVNLIGMEADDEDTIVKAITNDFTIWRDVVDRQHQGVVNSLLAMRMMSGRFVGDPNVQFGGKSAIDPSKRYYRGDSQGGIFGGTYMALTTDVQRGLLGEPGMPYNLLLSRSVDFEPFLNYLKLKYVDVINEDSTNDHLDLQIVLGVTQMVWDRTEPSGYFPYLSDNRLPGTPDHQVLMHVAIGDYQVTPLGAHIMARAIGAKLVTPSNREVWGLDTSPAPVSQSALVEFSFGLPEVPKTNVPPTGDMFPKDKDPHDEVRKLDAAVKQTLDWLFDGVVKQHCSGPCDPE